MRLRPLSRPNLEGSNKELRSDKVERERLGGQELRPLHQCPSTPTPLPPCSRGEGGCSTSWVDVEVSSA